MGTRQLFLIITLCVSFISCDYTNEFAIHVEEDVDVDQLASKHGLVNKGQIGSLVNHYLLEHPHVHKRSTEYAHEHHYNLRSSPGVLWVEQQQIKKRVKRNIEVDSASLPGRFPDPLFSKQWYINKGAANGFDMNTKDAWDMGFTGKNVVVTILDDGIQRDHPDLVLNYDPQASFDINDNDPDPTPQDNNDNKHGTRCAGEVAAEAYNDFCGVGIAYNASIGGVRMLDGTVTDHVEAKALSLNPSHIDIYSASWGPEDDGKTIDGPGKLAKKAFIDGIRSGRRGRGSIFVWASGNGGRKQDNCNCDGYTNSIYTLSISSATQSGSKPWYLEECSSTLATTYSSGSPGADQNIVTVDMDTRYRKSLAAGEPVTQYLCTQSHTGTSASAPIAAGIVALALEANPFLTWRDMQHLVVLTSRYEGLSKESGWQINGVGRRFSHKFGYGLMDAAAMVRLATTWQNVGQQRLCESETVARTRNSPFIIPSNGAALVTQIVSNACKNSPSEIRYLEHVQAVISVKFRPRGQLKITLTSPSGTSSSLLLPRNRDLEDGVIESWPFLSVHFWGESPNGLWKLSVENTQPRSGSFGTLESWSLVFHGTLEKPHSFGRNVTSFIHHLPRRTYPTPSEDNLIKSHCKESGRYSLSQSDSCLSKCPDGYFADTATGFCQRCAVSCATCYGSASENCLSCDNGTYYWSDRCVPQCPAGYYAHLRLAECLPCSSNCETCSQSPNSCTTCSTHLTLNSVSGNCTLACESTVNGSGCKKQTCHYLCSTCSGPGENECLTCPPNHRLIEGKCLEGDECPPGYFEDKSSTSTSVSCMKCHKSCRICNGTSHRHCIECSDSYRHVDGGLCSLCAPGQYLSRSGGSDVDSCAPCHDSCLECDGPKENNCIKCLEPQLFAQQGRCMPCCGPSEHTSPDQLDICCTCLSPKGPCATQQFARSVNYRYIQDKGPFARQSDSTSNSVIIASLLALSAFVVLIFIAFKSFIPHEDDRSLFSSLPAKSRPDLKYARLNLDVDDLEEESLFQRT